MTSQDLQRRQKQVAEKIILPLWKEFVRANCHPKVTMDEIALCPSLHKAVLRLGLNNLDAFFMDGEVFIRDGVLIDPEKVTVRQ